MPTVFSQAFVFVFSLFVLCFVTCAICGAVLFFWKAPRINAEFKHPLLARRAFRQYPFAIQAGIFLDYFLRLSFPRSKRWVAGYANQQLSHVDPKQVPLDAKWPIIGFWGSCFLGIIAMVSLWTLLLLSR
ncbi:membrane protein [Bordetella trematum]|uniref:hypothetical protein n=1 Tax=Bordetella trematum TaxID=123899 RepID=UPI00079ACC63|nr:hypothetical protein [Bordetella trematum]AUL47947.1 hypothetical protein BTL55_13860 [Bordetella trematum]SAI43574.1 membrane protein [Bordetella trematum]